MNNRIPFYVSICVVFLFAAALPWQQPKKFQPTEIEQLKLENLQKDARLKSAEMEQIKQSFLRAQQEFDALSNKLNQEAEKVRKAHNWEDAIFDPNTVTFQEAPKKKEEKKR